MSDDYFNEPVTKTCKCGKTSPPYPRSKWQNIWQAYLDTGFFPVICSDTSTYPLCPECTDKLRGLVTQILEITKGDANLYFGVVSKWLLKED